MRHDDEDALAECPYCHGTGIARDEEDGGGRGECPQCAGEGVVSEKQLTAMLLQ